MSIQSITDFGISQTLSSCIAFIEHLPIKIRQEFALLPFSKAFFMYPHRGGEYIINIFKPTVIPSAWLFILRDCSVLLHLLPLIQMLAKRIVRQYPF